MEKLTYNVKKYDFGYYISYQGTVSMLVGGRVLWTKNTGVKRASRAQAIQDAQILQLQLAEKNNIEVYAI